MVFDATKSFDVDADGYAVSVDGTKLFLLTAGVDSPVGQAAPVSSLYYQANGTVWEKTGAGDNDWGKLVKAKTAMDAILFDQTGNILVNETFNTLYGEV